MNNVLFNWNYRLSYYLIHPWKWFKELWVNLKNSWMRATKGNCYTDVWNLDSWFCSVLPPMFRHMADYGLAYPGHEPFETPEKWHQWLYEIADNIENLQYDDWLDNQNEYSQKYIATFNDDDKNDEKDEIRRLYYNRCKEIMPTRAQVLEEFGKKFFSAFDAYWD